MVEQVSRRRQTKAGASGGPIALPIALQMATNGSCGGRGHCLAPMHRGSLMFSLHTPQRQVEEHENQQIRGPTEFLHLQVLIPLMNMLYYTQKKKPPQDASCRLCCRCGNQYLVARRGHCVHQEECHYHWGRLRPTPAAGGWQIQYTCCSAPIGSPGCQVARQHVQDGRQQDLRGFVHTSDKELPPGAHPGIYALDCEMCYTTSGLELTRVSVVDSALRLVYDTFVRPDRDIVDYNTRFSGVTAAHLAHTSTSIRDVQAALLTLFNAHTILIGHGLQSDLLALKLIHSTVLDTSVLFPHRRGLPYKRSLRNLAAHYLGHIIQDRMDGHSSSEDASACMRLVLWKMGQHADTQR
ncbi:RNA exonuclease 1 like protein [Myotis brandtii]|uniref:RNA exonuclease 1 like protein n=1 Tax=Myotis brandtii TaxID=109478 RepID=S7MJE6_MYOBR|nr:RNA exonuclease 1 like protein [Myotis brandtii]